ncbi:hypothetical protein, partial [Rhizobium sp. 23-156E]
ASLLVMSLIIAVWMKARLVAEKRSKSFAIRRFMPSQASVRSTIHRFGSTWKPAWFRLIISIGRGLASSTVVP